jgi:TolB protein
VNAKRLRRLSTAALGGLAAAVAAAVLAAPAGASFPGKNGEIVFSTSGQYSELGLVNPDGSGATTLPLGGNNAFPSFSADGDVLVFSCGARLCTSNPDGTGKAKLPDSGPGDQRWPGFSRNGKLLTFVQGQGTLMIANANGKHAIEIPDAGKAWQPEFFPKGDKIVFSKAVGKEREIYSINADGSDLTRISKAKEGFIDVNPSVSPSGKRIVFERHRKSGAVTAAVWSIKADGSDGKAILKEAGTPTFSPTGQEIAYQSVGEGASTSSIGVADKNGADAKEITSTDLFDFAALPAWQPL